MSMPLIQEKVKQAVSILEEMNIDCWITFVRESALNGDPSLPFLTSAEVTWHSAFIIERAGGATAIVGQYDKKTVEDTGAYDNVIGFVEGIGDQLQGILNKISPDTIALNFSEGSEIADGITHGMFLTIRRWLDEIGMADRIVSAERVVSALRERKSPAELGHIRHAIRMTEEIFDAVSSFIAPGKTEKDIASFMKAEAKKRNAGMAWEPTACPAVFTGPDTAGAHYAPTNRMVERGHVLNMDFGLRSGEYCSDMQRTFYILDDGESTAPPDVQQGFDTIREAIEQARLAMAPGVLGKDVDAVARGIITAAGYDEYPHGLGHQVGRFSHDGTALMGPPWEKYAEKPFKPLEPNMVFTIEPRLTVPGRGIVTIEEMVVVTNDGAEYLSHPQTDLILIG
ncbi:MAG: aminopeptidase P family protein [Candidatus Latescibacterota bacterium]|nr:MAG: aminopeptidase P family protein [Candidatus Latescibacterota bacterium]